jgi:hypothetical protein
MGAWISLTFNLKRGVKWLMQAIPVLLAILVGLLFALLAWGSLRIRKHEAGETLVGTGDGVLTGLLVLAAFALGVFLTYMVITVG